MICTNDNWRTPRSILKRVEKVLGEDYFDPCPVTPTFNGLEVWWMKRCFINPPYSRGSLEKWSDKALIQYDKGLNQTLPMGFIWLINYGNCANRIEIKKKSVSLCDLYERIAFIDPETGQPKKGNDRDQILYLWTNEVEIIEKFEATFEDLGSIFHAP